MQAVISKYFYDLDNEQPQESHLRSHHALFLCGGELHWSSTLNER